MLIDSRHGIKQIDLEFLSFLKKNKLNFRLVLTKSDKLTLSNKEKILETFNKYEKKPFNKTIFTSTKTKEGIKELKRDIIKIISKNEKKTNTNI